MYSQHAILTSQDTRKSKTSSAGAKEHTGGLYSILIHSVNFLPRMYFVVIIIRIDGSVKYHHDLDSEFQSL